MSDMKWSGAQTGSTLATWTAGNDAWFVPPSNGVPSTITINSGISAMSIAISGSPYHLVVTNGGNLTNGIATIGNTAGSAGNGNSVVVTGTGSMWTNSGQLTIGYGKGSSNLLTVANEGIVFASSLLVGDDAGYGGPANFNQIIIDGGSIFAPTVSVSYYTASMFNSLIITNGGKLISNPGGQSFVGRFSGNNSAIVTGPGSVWSNGAGSIDVGYTVGTNNRLTIAQGGQVICPSLLISVDSPNAGSNTVVVAGTGSVLRVTSLFVDYCANSTGMGGNWLILTNGGMAIADSGLYIGGHPPGTAQGGAGKNNTVRIAGTGSIFAAGAVYISGYWGYNNRLEVLDGGTLNNSGVMNVGFENYGPACSNVFLLQNAVAMNGLITVGYANGPYACTDNSLIASNAVLASSGLTIGKRIASTAPSNNAVMVLGGTVWNGRGGALVIGWGAETTGNTLTNSGGVMTNFASLSIGISTNSANNALTVTAGGILEVNGSLAVATNNYLNLLGGVLGAANTIYTNGMFIVGDGLQSATLKSLSGGTLNFAAGLLINTNSHLRGQGCVSGGSAGIVITNGGFLSPGVVAANGVTGTLTGIGPVSLAPGSIPMIEISGSAGPGNGWGLFAVTNGTMNLGGNLKGKMIGDYRPDYTDVFMVITSTSPLVGAFDNVINDGRISVLNSNALRVVGTFRVGISNQYVLLDSFRPYSGGALLFVK